MDFNITTILGIISIVFCVATFVTTRKDKSNSFIGKEQYEKGKLDQQLKNIFEKLDKIDNKLDNYDKEIQEKIAIAMKQHEKLYHNKGVQNG